MTTDEQTFCAADAPHLKATVDKIAYYANWRYAIWRNGCSRKSLRFWRDH
jgi:hypothetical protein